mgnify:CR=1 FL=1
MNQRDCAACGKPFDVNPRERRPRLTCSERCRGLRRHGTLAALTHAPCPVCGADMTGRRSDAQYCASACWDVANGKRRAEPLALIHCALSSCGVEFQPTHSNQRCCTEKHGKALDKLNAKSSGRDMVAVPCAVCASDVLAYPGRTVRAKCCSAECRDTYVAGLPKRVSKSFYVSKSNRAAIYQRDGWTCQLCFEPVQSDLDPLDNWAPSLDHIICQSWTETPDHSPENLRLAHRWCNSVRGNETYYTAAEVATLRR